MSLSTTDSSELSANVLQKLAKNGERVCMGFGSEYTLSTH
jgi:hypothetical protein